LRWLPAILIAVGLLYSCASAPLADNEVELREKLLAIALEQRGVPYHYGGGSRKGFDCSGLVQYSFAQIGLNVPRNSYDQYRYSTPVYISRIQAGDLLFFRTDNSFVTHVGIYIGDNLFVHAPGKGKYVTTERLDESYYQKRLVGVGSMFQKAVLREARLQQ
jgi:cell wall-associated NlpC family hydrolase